MPKFLTYQRPAPVSKTNWNGAPKQQPALPRKESVQAKPPPQPTLPPLDELLRKD